MQIDKLTELLKQIEQYPEMPSYQEMMEYCKEYYVSIDFNKTEKEIIFNVRNKMIEDISKLITITTEALINLSECEHLLTQKRIVLFNERHLLQETLENRE